jgi:hypothetical protein
MRRWITAITLIGTSVAAPPLAAQVPQPLGWMVGTWCTPTQGGTQTCETWQHMVGNTMQGLSRTRRPDGTARTETMRIARTSSQYVVHVESPGEDAADFFSPLVETASRSVTFTNAANPYPQRIRYWREGEVLVGEVSMLDGSRTTRWRLLPALGAVQPR